MKTYQQLLQSTELILREAPSPTTELPDELTLQSAWYAGSFGTEFTTLEKQTVKLIDLGHWNRGPGPDFTNCTIQLDGQTITGDIELDHHAENWESHGHATNPTFTNTILHIIFSPPHTPADEQSECKPLKHFCRDLNHREIPRAVISSPQLQKLQLTPSSQALAHPGHCADSIAHLPHDRLHQLLKSASLHRASLKATRHHRLANTHGTHQAHWQNLATTLGYGPNKNTFHLLAQRLPINKLLQESPADIPAIIFGTVGLLHPDLHKTAPPESKDHLEQLWKTWWKHRQTYELHPSRALTLKLSQVRPQNHPHRRLAALAQTAIHFQKISKLITTAELSPNFTDLKNSLFSLEDPFWNHHYTLTSKNTTKPIALWGTPRINDFLINHLHPLLLAKDPEKHWPHYAKLKNNNPSTTVKIAQTRLLHDHPKKDHLIQHHWQQQALLQLYQDFCLKDHSNCQNCPLPQQLKNF